MTESQYDYSGTPTTQQYQAAVGAALLMAWEQGAQIFNWYLCNIPPGGTAPYFASLLSPTDGVTKPTTITTSGYAWTNMLSWLIGSKLSFKSLDSSSTYTYFLTLNTYFGSKSGYIIFNTSGTNYTVTLPYGGISTMIDLAGNVTQVVTGQIIPVTTAPVLVF
jgi:hypothetical protein